MAEEQGQEAQPQEVEQPKKEIPPWVDLGPVQFDEMDEKAKLMFGPGHIQDKAQMDLYKAQMKKEGWRLFRMGSCSGTFRDVPRWVECQSIRNAEPGNGLLMWAIEALYGRAIDNGRGLRMIDVSPPQFRDFLIDRCGFRLENRRNIVKQQNG